MTGPSLIRIGSVIFWISSPRVGSNVLQRIGHLTMNVPLSETEIADSGYI